jgi:hypothetical protein
VTTYAARPAILADASAIARIYSEGIADRIATFETETRTSGEILEWFRPGTLIVVAGAERASPPSPRRFHTARDHVTRGLVSSRSMLRGTSVGKVQAAWSSRRFSMAVR